MAHPVVVNDLSNDCNLACARARVYKDDWIHEQVKLGYCKPLNARDAPRPTSTKRLNVDCS
jgi:hypothetical protein